MEIVIYDQQNGPRKWFHSCLAHLCRRCCRAIGRCQVAQFYWETDFFCIKINIDGIDSSATFIAFRFYDDKKSCWFFFNARCLSKFEFNCLISLLFLLLFKKQCAYLTRNLLQCKQAKTEKENITCFWIELHYAHVKKIDMR